MQKPFSTSIFAQKSGPPAWRQLPTWYQVSENDHMILPDAERMFAKQMNAITIPLPSSHASLVSNEIAKLILNAAINPTRRKRLLSEQKVAASDEVGTLLLGVGHHD